MKGLDWRRPEVLLASFLILVGLLWLVNNLGLPVCNVIWPILLIGLGVWLIVGRTATPEGPGIRSYDRAIGNAAQVSLHLPAGAGDLRLGALPAGDQLVAAHFDLATAASYEETGSEGHLRFSRAAAVWWFPFFSWIAGNRRLELSRAVRWQIEGRWLVGDLRLDCSGLQVVSLDLDSCVGDLEVTFPATGQVVATASSTLGDLDLRIPAGAAARIRFSVNMLGDTRIDQRFERRAGEYVTPGYETATERLELDLRVGSHLGDLRLR